MSTILVLLGTGTPNCEPMRFQQSAAIIVNDQPYLIDCGGGTMQRISQARANGVEPLHFTKLTRLFITHLHPDHTVGLPDLMIHPWVLERTDPLEIYGPVGTQAMVDHLLQAYEIGLAEHGRNIPTEKQLRVIVHEFEEGQIYTDEAVTVEALRVTHGSLDAFALKFTTPDKTIVHSGDTGPVERMASYAKGCDILIHEVYFTLGLATRDPAWQQYHSKAHTSGQELIAIANEARPTLLILNHQLVWGEQYTEQHLIGEIKAGYDGEVVYGRDLAVFT